MKREYVKLATNLVANFSAGYAVTAALKSVVPADTKAQIVLKFIGIAVLSGAISKPVSKYINETIDETAANLGFPMPDEEEV